MCYLHLHWQLITPIHDSNFGGCWYHYFFEKWLFHRVAFVLPLFVWSGKIFEICSANEGGETSDPSDDVSKARPASWSCNKVWFFRSTPLCSRLEPSQGGSADSNSHPLNLWARPGAELGSFLQRGEIERKREEWYKEKDRIGVWVEMSEWDGIVDGER